jgi:hypothetical protein
MSQLIVARSLFPHGGTRSCCRRTKTVACRTGTDGQGHLLKTDQRGMPRPDKEDNIQFHLDM